LPVLVRYILRQEFQRAQRNHFNKFTGHFHCGKSVFILLASPPAALNRQ